jgi:phage gp29-like protein
MQIEVDWLSDEKKAWDATDCLYAYLHPKTDEILFIGSAFTRTVRERFDAQEKDDLFEYFDAIHRLNPAELKIAVGEVWLDEGQHLTRELLTDVESVLVKRVQPPGNIPRKVKKISRPGVIVKCTGEWPHERKIFVDTE